jgi:hypothetical protein
MTRRAAWVVRGPNGMWLGGRRHDEGPLWRLFRKDAARYRTRQDAEVAARWSGGTVEEETR